LELFSFDIVPNCFNSGTILLLITQRQKTKQSENGLSFNYHSQAQECLITNYIQTFALHPRKVLPVEALSPDENEISLYMITTCLNIQVTRIEEVITKDEMS